MARATKVAVCIVLLFVAAPVRADPADDIVLPPSDLQGSYDEATREVSLAWSPPDQGIYTYHIYRNGEEVAVTDSTTYTDNYAADDATGSATYYVQASAQDSVVQSGPSNPYVLTAAVTMGPVLDLMDAVGDFFSRDFVKYDLPGNWCTPIGIGGGLPPIQIDWGCLRP